MRADEGLFQVSFHLDLDTDPVSRVHPLSPLLVDPAQSVREVLAVMKDNSTGSVLVCRDGKMEGIFTERDALRLMAKRADLNAISVGDVMTRDPESLKDSDTVGTAIKRMSTGGYRRIPVLDDDGRPLSILKVSSILHYLVEHFPQFIYNLPPEPHHATQEREGA